MHAKKRVGCNVTFISIAKELIIPSITELDYMNSDVSRI